jgi:hypothetical protein
MVGGGPANTRPAVDGGSELVRQRRGEAGRRTLTEGSIPLGRLATNQRCRTCSSNERRHVTSFVERTRRVSASGLGTMVRAPSCPIKG